MNFKKKYIVATRPSLLAFTQTEQTINSLKEKNPEIEFEIVKFSTHGDNVVNKPLTEFGGTGVFVKELENAMANGEADFAIHSLKDVPSIQPDGFILAAFPKREDPRDVILTKNSKTLMDLKDDCIIGTGSPRRIVQIAKLKPNARFKDLRGNIDTRIRKLEEEQYDAIVIAAAGLNRLGKLIPENSYISMKECIPAIGQGIICLECKNDDFETINLLRTINHTETEIKAKAERKFMATIGGGCKFPLAAHATIEYNNITLNAMIGNHITNEMIFDSITSNIENSDIIAQELGIKIKTKAESLGIDFLI